MAFVHITVQGAFAFKAWNGAFESHIGVEVGALTPARYACLRQALRLGAQEAHRHCVPLLAGLGLHGDTNGDRARRHPRDRRRNGKRDTRSSHCRSGGVRARLDACMHATHALQAASAR